MTYRVSLERARGCGFRKEGGLYLVAPQLTEPCPRLPMAVESCPTCGEGVKPARSWTWIRPAELFPAQDHGDPFHNMGCPLSPVTDQTVIDDHGPRRHRTEDDSRRAGLIWVGEGFYATAEAFMQEAAQMGVSRRIAALPKGFEVGKTWVYLGHRKALGSMSRSVPVSEIMEHPTKSLSAHDYVDGWQPGIITLFMPTAVEYVLKQGEEGDVELQESLAKRGIQAVKVIRDE
jgi:hypothetical protein